MTNGFDKSEFLDDFLAECREHLEILNQLLLELEDSPGDQSLLEAVGRELHTIKAAARMMGFETIENLTHRLEDLFEDIFQNRVAFDSAVNDVLLNVVDAYSPLLQALPQPAPEVDLEKIYENLSLVREDRLEEVSLLTWEESEFAGSEEEEQEASEEELLASEEEEDRSEVEESQFSEREGESELVASSPSEEGKTRKKKGGGDSSPGGQSDTAVREERERVRVRTDKLDHLMNLAGELVMFKIRSKENESQLNELLNQSQSLTEDYRKLKNLLNGSLKNGEKKFRAFDQIEGHLADLVKEISQALNHLREDSTLLNNVSEGLRNGIMQLRMVPLQQLFQLIPRVIRDLARQEGKEVDFHIEGENIEVDRKILEKVKDPLIHLIRNAVSHGIESPAERSQKGKEVQGKIELKAYRQGDQILVEIEDDGRGIDPDMIRDKATNLGLLTAKEAENISTRDVLHLLFKSGFSTRSEAGTISGRGLGLNIVDQRISDLKGSVSVQSELGQGTTFTLRLPLSLATIHVLVVKVEEETYALPIHAIREILPLERDQIEKVGDKDSLYLRDTTVPLIDLAQVLDRPFSSGLPQREVVLVVSEEGEQAIGFAVDEVLGEQEIVSKSLGKQVRKVPNIQGGSILGRGEVVLILNIPEVLQRSRNLGSSVDWSEFTQTTTTETERDQIKVLVVDDSITTRKLEKAILEAAGYQVQVAINGQEALKKLNIHPFDIVITDVQMPLMDGFELTENIKKDSQFKDIPVIIVTSLDAQKHIERGNQVGAEGYITKGQFNQETLISLIEKLT